MEPESRRIYIDFFDLERLRLLLRSQANLDQPGRDAIRALAADLEDAVVITPQVFVPSVVTMNSRVRLRNEQTGEASEYKLAFPGKSSRGLGKLSVITPLGASLLGRSERETITVQSTTSPERFTITEIVRQPESSGALV